MQAYQEDLAAKLKASQEGVIPTEGDSAMHETAKEWPQIKPVIY